MVKVIFHTKEATLWEKFFPLREVPILKRAQLKRITAKFSNLPLMWASFSVFWLPHWLLYIYIAFVSQSSNKQCKQNLKYGIKLYDCVYKVYYVGYLFKGFHTKSVKGIYFLSNRDH